MQNPKFRIAIVGGGIAGLTMAIAISRFSSERKDIHVDIYESSSAFTEIGAGVVLFLRPWRVLKALGLEEALRRILPQTPNENEIASIAELRKADQPEGVTFYHLKAPFGILGFHRAKLLEVLASSFDKEICSSYFSKRLVSYSDISGQDGTGSIRLQFADGSSATTDILIGCDGINSIVRQYMLSNKANELKKSGDFLTATELVEAISPVWSGTYAYRSVFPSAKLAAINSQHAALSKSVNYMGKDKHVIVFPLRHSQVINAVALTSSYERTGTIHVGKNVEIREREELLSQYEGWEDEVTQILQCMDKPSRWVINSLKGLPSSVSEREHVALAGDAAHAMTPHQGSGAGQAIEDAYVLATLLAHPQTTVETLPEALKAYEAVRLPFANDVLRRSFADGCLYEFADPRFAHLGSGPNGEAKMVGAGDASTLEGIGRAADESTRWRWDTDVEDDRKRAIQLFESWMGART